MLELKAFIVLCIAAFNCVFAKPTLRKDPPTWPTTYTVIGVLYLPYAEIKEPFQAWFDKPNKRSRIDYYGGKVFFINTIKQSGG